MYTFSNSFNVSLSSNQNRLCLIYFSTTNQKMDHDSFVFNDPIKIDHESYVNQYMIFFFFAY